MRSECEVKRIRNWVFAFFWAICLPILAGSTMTTEYTPMGMKSNTLDVVRFDLPTEEDKDVYFIGSYLELMPNQADQVIILDAYARNGSEFEGEVSIENAPNEIGVAFTSGLTKESLHLEGWHGSEIGMTIDASRVQSELLDTGIAHFSFDVVVSKDGNEVNRSIVNIKVFDSLNTKHAEMQLHGVDEINESTIYIDERKTDFTDASFRLFDPKDKATRITLFVNGENPENELGNYAGEISLDQDNQITLDLYQLCNFGYNKLTFVVSTTYGDSVYFQLVVTLEARGELSIQRPEPLYIGIGNYSTYSLTNRLKESSLQLFSNGEEISFDSIGVKDFFVPSLPVSIGETNDIGEVEVRKEGIGGELPVAIKGKVLFLPIYVDNLKSDTIVVNDNVSRSGNEILIKRGSETWLNNAYHDSTYFDKATRTHYIRFKKDPSKDETENTLTFYIKGENYLIGYIIDKPVAVLSELTSIPSVVIERDPDFLKGGYWVISLYHNVFFSTYSDITVPQGLYDLNIYHQDNSGLELRSNNYQFGWVDLKDSIRVDSQLLTGFSRVIGKVPTGWKISVPAPIRFGMNFSLGEDQKLFVRKGVETQFAFNVTRTINEQASRPNTIVSLKTPPFIFTEDVTTIETDCNFTANLFKELPDSFYYTASDRFGNELTNFDTNQQSDLIALKFKTTSGESYQMMAFGQWWPYYYDMEGNQIARPTMQIERNAIWPTGSTYSVTMGMYEEEVGANPVQPIDVSELLSLYREARLIGRPNVDTEPWDSLNKVMYRVREYALGLSTQEMIDDVTIKLKIAVEAARLKVDTKLIDINQDNEVNISDVQALYLHVMKIKHLDIAKERLDYNIDGLANIKDVQELYLHVLGIQKIEH